MSCEGQLLLEQKRSQEQGLSVQPQEHTHPAQLQVHCHPNTPNSVYPESPESEINETQGKAQGHRTFLAAGQPLLLRHV